MEDAAEGPAGCARPERRLADIDVAAAERSFRVNALGPLLVLKHVEPLLRQSGGPAYFASISARVGSIGDNRIGGWYSYRAAKAAQNQFVHTASIELARRHSELTCVTLHPGTVDTALSEPFQGRVKPENDPHSMTTNTTSGSVYSYIKGFWPFRPNTAAAQTYKSEAAVATSHSPSLGDSD